MEHPFLPSNTLSDLSLDELQSKISDLTGKLTYAYRTQNGALIHQLRMVIESHRNQYTKKMDEMVSKQNIQTKININKD
jgi:hypothetical protein